jgi:hypothetical protein
MAEIDHLDRIDAINLAKKMRNKVRNLEVDKKALGTGALGAIVASGASYGLGRYMGGLEVEYEQNQAAIDAGEMDDPRKLAGMDLDGVIGAAATGLGLLAVAKAKGKAAQGAEILLRAGEGMLAGYTYSLGYRQGREAASAA